jgi:hypothetical protein
MSQAQNQKSGAELRRSPRRVFRRAIGLLYRGTYAVVRAVQLSEGGLLFTAPWALEAGDQVAITLMLPLGGSCIVRAEILYASTEEKGAYGARFKDVLSLAQRRLIRSYVSAKTQQEAADERFS